MLNYTGVKCPVCGVPFQDNDDIVVCPECGAPYHRNCYHQAGKCIFDDLHKEGKEWQPPEPPKAPDHAAEDKDRECPVCGTLNGHSALFCSRCGASLSGEPKVYSNSNPGRSGTWTGPGVSPPYSPYGAPPFAYDPMGGVSPADMLDEGVTYGDVSKLVKQNTNYYMSVFRYIKLTRRNKFNFSAFLFSGIWMLYRKQYKYGIIVTALLFSLYLASLLISLFVSAPLLVDLAEQVGMDLTQGINPASSQWTALSELLLNNPVAYLKLALPTLCLLAALVMRIVVGVLGNKLYLEHCVRTVRKVKSEPASDNLSLALEAKGGVNTPLAISMAVCYLLLVFLML